MKPVVHAVVLVVACLLTVTAGTRSLSAHHSFAATYLEKESVTIEGQLVQLQFRNPHSFVQMIVQQRDGTDIRYAAEWRGAGELVMQGVTNGTLRVGDRLVVTGNPSRNTSEHRIRLLRLVRPRDGFVWTWPTK
jgi:hypothetical protein